MKVVFDILSKYIRDYP